MCLVSSNTSRQQYLRDKRNKLSTACCEFFLRVWCQCRWSSARFRCLCLYILPTRLLPLCWSFRLLWPRPPQLVSESGSASAARPGFRTGSLSAERPEFRTDETRDSPERKSKWRRRRKRSRPQERRVRGGAKFCSWASLSKRTKTKNLWRATRPSSPPSLMPAKLLLLIHSTTHSPGVIHMSRETNKWSPSIYKSECPVDWTAERERSYNFQAPVWNGKATKRKRAALVLCKKTVNK